VAGLALGRVMNLLAGLAMAYLLLMVLARVFENHLIYFPQLPGRTSGEWHPQGLPIEETWLRTSDGVKLHAWWIPAPEAEFTFISFHGNAGNITHRAEVFAFLHELPANVLAVEYRGYGKSEGRPDERGLYLDAQAAWEHLVRERGIPPRRVIAFGQSLGTAVAADLAASREVGGVVLEAPFASVTAVARRAYFFLPGITALMKTKLATGEKLAASEVPLLVVHCTRDPVIPFPLGERVFELARGPKWFFRVEGHCHEEAAFVAPAEYRARLLEFLEEIRRSR
jgi:fermentation-respiration switch protein FrsA (DUF1100 family)